MNVTGLNVIKTLGCMTAVTFFTVYNTWDRYDYDYHWILAFLTFISTIATPLFFCRRRDNGCPFRAGC